MMVSWKSGKTSTCARLISKANTKYIVTQDHHYDVLRNIPFPKIEVVDIDEFLIILGFLFYRESASLGVFNAILNDEFTLFVWLKL